MKKRLRRCQRPSFEISVPENFSLSDITKSAKKTRDEAKQNMHTAPKIFSPHLNERIATSRGTKRKSVKPKAEPAPWIFDEVVEIVFDSFTLKKHVKMHEPIAKIAIKTIVVVVRIAETEW